MRIHDPFWLYFLMVVPMAVALSWWGVSRSEKAFHRFISATLIDRLADMGRFARRKRSAMTLGFSACFLIFALARPQYGVKPVEVTRSGIDAMIILDVSKSMTARDITPDRISRAVNEINKLISALEGNRLGLITFAGESFVECPLTLDVSTLRLFLDTVGPGSIPSPGTNVEKAIRSAVKAFATSKALSKVAILITDGESLEGDVTGATQLAADNRIVIFPIGIGSTSGAPIPEISESGKVTGYKKDESGETVISRLDVDTLGEIASATSGEYYLSQGGSLDLTPMIEKLKGMEKTDIREREFTEYEERYQIAVLLALALLLFDYFRSVVVRRPENA